MTLTRKEDRMLQGFADIVEPMDTLLVTAERRCETENSRSCKTKLQPRKGYVHPGLQQKTFPSHGSGNWTSRNDDNGAIMSCPQLDTRGKFRPNNQIYDNPGRNRPFERRDFSNNNNDNRYNDYRAGSPYQPHRGQSRIWGSNDNYSRSPSTPRQDSSADNPDQIHLIIQCLTVLETKLGTTIYHTRSSRPPITVICQT